MIIYGYSTAPGWNVNGRFGVAVRVEYFLAVRPGVTEGTTYSFIVLPINKLSEYLGVIAVANISVR